MKGGLNNFYSQGDFFKEKFQLSLNENEILKNENEFYKNEAQSCQAPAQVEKEIVINECNFGEQTLLQPVGNIAMTLIRTIENAREINACGGMSTNYGYLTARLGMLTRKRSRYKVGLSL